MSAVLCVDFGSTFTKGVVVDIRDGALLASASHPTTSSTDVLEGYAALRQALGLDRPGGPRVETVLACSSAGGGLRLAVVGYERAVTAEAGHRVGLSAGARVVHVHAGALDTGGIEALCASRPDVVLLVGGTDAGNAEVLLHNARRLGTARVAAPVVLAGNAEVREECRSELERRDRTVVATANVLPRIGVLDPRPARVAIREVFLRHVIGGKGLSRGRRFADMVRGATPDLVLTGVELLADGATGVDGVNTVDGLGDVLVVDVGGATTDVYSVITPEGEDAALRKDVVETLWRARTVEGDLGMRWNAPAVVQAARAERLLGDDAAGLPAAAACRAAAPGWVPMDAAGRDDDARLAELAVTIALRRHARPAVQGAVGRDLRRVAAVVGSGGVLRHGDDALRRRVLSPATGDHAGGWRVPESARVLVDERYVLFAAGLLAQVAPEVAATLVTRELVAVPAL